MSAEVSVRGTTVLSIAPDQMVFNDDQIAVLRTLGVKDATKGDLAVFFHQAVKTGLDPFAKQIYMIGRWTKEGTKQTIQTGIDGYRLVARRAANRSHEVLSYEDTAWCGKDGQWTDVWLSEDPPAAAKVTITRGGARFSAVALWKEYVQTNRDGTPTAMWSRMGANQLAKCAEALVLRKAFPQDLSGIYTEEEVSGQIIGSDPEAPANGKPGDLLRAAAGLAAEVVEPEPADDEVLDAEIIAEPPAPIITTDHLRQLQNLFHARGFVDDSDVLMFVAQEVGRELSGLTQLLDSEGAQLVAILNELP